MASSKEALTRLDEVEFRRAIEEPAEKVGLKFENGVVDNLVRDLAEVSAGLPLLQFTLMMLWQERVRNRISLDAYESLGGGRKALENTANRLYEGMARRIRAWPSGSL